MHRCTFFDTTVTDWIINRFSNEIDSVDSAIPSAFSQLLTTHITVVVALKILI